jgi:hypothetical protein
MPLYLLKEIGETLKIWAEGVKHCEGGEILD